MGCSLVDVRVFPRVSPTLLIQLARDTPSIAIRILRQYKTKRKLDECKRAAHY